MLELLLFGFTSMIVGFSGALTPGPVLIATISESTRRGFIAGPLIVLGHIAVEVMLIAALLLGLSPILKLTAAQVLVGTLGGLVLLWMGSHLLKTASKSARCPSRELERSGKHSTVVLGVLTSVSNPYFFLWWATVGSAFVMKGGVMAGFVGISAFAIGHWMSDLSWYSFVSFCTHKGRRFMTDKTYKIIMGACGVFLFALGLIFLKDGIAQLI
jgi:threonine/homoserine/homoserine lactone efflux protein